jgi:REP element-mobilizing transposase RayT
VTTLSHSYASSDILNNIQSKGRNAMSRPLRVEYAGAFYHVMNRGNAGDFLFQSKKERERFVECLENAVERFSLKIHAYCLMGNHYHLLIETIEPNLSRAMQWIQVSYAAYFNRKRNRVGHLFMGRFKSILIDADTYLLELSRYIHLNPVRAKLVENPADYTWSSYGAFIGKRKAPEWLETEWLLSQFGRTTRTAGKNYRDFVEGIEIEKLVNPGRDLVGGFILGSSEFVGRVKEMYLSSQIEEKEIPQLKKLKPRIEVRAIIRAVADEFGCKEEDILLKGRKKNVPRDIAIYLARNLTGESGVNLGKRFGNITGAGITVRCANISKEMSKSPKVLKKINTLKNQIINN